MINLELVRQLLKELEAAKGGPVQLRVDTPESERPDSGLMTGAREYFGQFEKREAVVRRVSDLEQKYQHDIALIEGEYSSLRELQKKIDGYNIFYGPIMGPDTPTGKAFDLVQKEMKGPITRAGLAWNFGEAVSQQKVEEIFQKNGIIYFNHRIIARPDGVYDDRTIDGTISVPDETKIGDIFLKLIE